MPSAIPLPLLLPPLLGVRARLAERGRRGDLSGIGRDTVEEGDDNKDDGETGSATVAANCSSSAIGDMETRV